MRVSRLLCLVAVFYAVFPLLRPSSAVAKNCGGAVECACGDRVVEDAALFKDIGPCKGDGLRLQAGNLDCQGFRILGLDNRKDYDGIRVDSPLGSAIRNCRISGFYDGVYFDGYAGSSMAQSESIGNFIGIRTGDGASGIQISENYVHLNRGQGIHIGGGSHQVEVLRNILGDNGEEGIFIIEAIGTKIHGNTISRARDTAILLKHARNSTVTNNAIEERSIYIRGLSFGNVFEGNVLKRGRFTFEGIREDGLWSFPHHNTVTGGKVLRASRCFEFSGAHDNIITQVETDGCTPSVERELGGRLPSGNIIVLLGDEAPPLPQPPSPIGGSGSGGSTGGSTGSGQTGSGSAGEGMAESPDGKLRRGEIRISNDARREDQLKIRADFYPPAGFRVQGKRITLAVADGARPVYQSVVDPDMLRTSSRGIKFGDARGRKANGLRILQIREQRDAHELSVVVKSKFTGSVSKNLIITLHIGEERFELVGQWEKRGSGYQLARRR